MLDSLRHAYDPQWPVGWEARVDLGLIVLYITFKWLRAYKMGRYATRINRLGASTIASDIAVGCAFAMTVIYTLFPPLYAHDLYRMSIRFVFGLPIAWAFVEVIRARPVRIETVMGGSDATATSRDVSRWNRTVRPLADGE